MVRTFEERDGKPFAIEGGPVNLGIAVDVEKKDGSHSLMVPAIKGADGLDFAGFHSYYEELIAKTRENKLTADDFQGTNISLTNPGGIGTVASVPRLLSGQSAIIATGSIAYPPEWLHASPERLKQLGVSKVMTMTSTYDHRVIQGAESGAFLRRVEQLLQGEDGFYETVAADLGIDAAGVTSAHPASASAPPLGGAAAAPTAEPSTAPGEVDEELLQAVQAATSLLKAYRTHGHLAAQLDPLGSEPKGDPALQPENLNLTPELMARIPASILRIGVPGETLLEALPRMRQTYCGTIAYQFEHLSSHQQRIWLREMIETGAHRQPLTDDEKRRLLEPPDRRLPVRALPREGLPRPEDVLDRGARRGRADARRGGHPLPPRRRRGGRLRDGPPRPPQRPRPQPRPPGRVDPGRVRGLEADRRGEGGGGDPPRRHRRRQVPLRPPRRLRDQPRARRSRSASTPTPATSSSSTRSSPAAPASCSPTSRAPSSTHDPKRAVPVLLHGDAAFPAQGVVAETLNLQALNGYSTGGTIHIIQNNQVGFTTDPEEARSTPYAADMAKGFNVPIVHVNADDVEACSAAVRLAMAYRERWGRDIVIDVIGYRRFGHNETDEPAYTQPTMAAKIKAHPPVSEIYAEKLIGEGTVSAEEVGQASEQRREEMATALKGLREKMEAGEYEDPTVTGTTSTGELLDRTASPPVAHRGPGREAARAQRGPAEDAGGLQRPPQAAPAALQADRGARAGRDRLRPGRGPRLRLAADRGRPHPAHRPGHRARHLLPPSPRPPRREHRPQVHADAEPRGRLGAVRALQQPALGDRLPRLRVRLLGGHAERAGPLGGPVRRLRQRRPGDRRQLHRLRRVEVGPDQPPHPAAAARLRGLRARALQRPHRALPRPRRRGQHPHRLPDHRRPVLPPAAPPGPDPQAPAADRLHPQGAAAARPRHRQPRGADRGALPLHPRRPQGEGAAREGRAAGPLHRQGLLRHRRQRAPRRAPRTSPSPGSRCCTRSRRNSCRR